MCVDLQVPYLDFQGICIECNPVSNRYTGNETLNATDFTAFVGTPLPANYDQELTKCEETDSRGWCIHVDIVWYNCSAEYYCANFSQYFTEMRQWCLCPPGTYSTRGFGPCSLCAVAPCDEDFGQTSCTPCATCSDTHGGGLSVETWNIPLNGFCQCPLGYKGLTRTPGGNS